METRGILGGVGRGSPGEGPAAIQAQHTGAVWRLDSETKAAIPISGGENPGIVEMHQTQ